MQRAWRIIFVTGLALLLVPCVAVRLFENRDWVAHGIYGAAVYAGGILLVAWGVGEFVFHFFSKGFVGVIILAAAIPLVGVPVFFINEVTFLGRATADIDFWQPLLPLLTVMLQVTATLFVTTIVAAVMIVKLARRALRKNAAA